MSALHLQHLRQHWPRIAVASLSLYTLVDSLRAGPFRYPWVPPDKTATDAANMYKFFYTYMAIGIAIDLHRIHVAVYKSSTRSTQFAFNLWLTGAVAFYFVLLYSEILYYFVPLPKAGVATNNKSTVETATVFTPGQQDHPLSPLSLQTTTSQKWDEIKYHIDCGLHLVLGIGLKVILNQRRQLDLERDEQQQQRLHHQLVVSSDKELPTPVASASSVEGFRTAAELGRLRLRVPTWPRFVVAIWFLWLIYDGANRVSHFTSEYHRSAREYAQLAISLTQSIAGLYILYRKSLVMTQWLFYSLCVTTAYQTNEDFKKNIAELAETIEDGEGGAISKEFPDMTDEEVLQYRIISMTIPTLFYLGRLWVAWRLIADLKARNARVAKAASLVWEREMKVEKREVMDGIVTEANVQYSCN